VDPLGRSKSHSDYCEGCAELLGDAPLTEVLFIRNDDSEHAPHVWFHTSCWEARTAGPWYREIPDPST
jgi:hypothetical protein